MCSLQRTSHLLVFIIHRSEWHTLSNIWMTAVELGNTWPFYFCFKETEAIWREYYQFFFWTLTILSILLWFLACCTFLTPFCEWILPLILHYLHAIYFLPGTFKDKKCTSLTFLFLWRSVYNIKICLLSNLSGGSRKVTNPLKVELGTVTSI